MLCPSCQRQIADHVAFCNYCGRPTGAAPVPGPLPPTPNPADAVVGLIVPIGRNPLAVVSRVAAMVSVVPCAALLLGPVAIVTGALALRAYNRDPSVRFRGSALFGIILGSLTLAANLIGLLLMLLGPHSAS